MYSYANIFNFPKSETAASIKKVDMPSKTMCAIKVRIMELC